MQSVQFGMLSPTQQRRLNVRLNDGYEGRGEFNGKVTVSGRQAGRMISRSHEGLGFLPPSKRPSFYMGLLNKLAKAMKTAGHTPVQLTASDRARFATEIAGKDLSGKGKLNGQQLQLVAEKVLEGLMKQVRVENPEKRQKQAETALNELMKADVYIMPDTQFETLMNLSGKR